MKYEKRLIAYILLLCMLFAACSTPSTEKNEADIAVAHFSYEFADVEKGTQLLLGNTEYHENMTKTDFEYRLQKKSATRDEYIAYAKAQVMDFTEEEKVLFDECMERIEEILVKKGYKLPEIDTINFVKTTMSEEGGASAYTHKSDIYLGAHILDRFLNDPEADKIVFVRVLLHELFHCLTRNHPDFRKDMYEIINFTVAEKDFEISPRIRELMISNPDVGNHDSYASFTINGEKMDCFAVYVATKEFEKEGDLFFNHANTHLIPIDSPDTLYTMDDAADFWDVFGRNTDYVLDPEECLADNFSYAILNGEEDFGNIAWPNPEIIEKISALLQA